MDIEIKHVVEALIKQLQDTYKNTEAVKANEELDEPSKNASLNFYGYHMAVLSILMKYLGKKTVELYPDAIGLVDWAEQNYNEGVKQKYIIPCSCSTCLPQPKVEESPKVV